jgi:putative tryptophan/tyrosine transport system substrate-binding protein
VFDARGADGKIALLPQLARELAASKVDAVVASNYPTAVALKPTGVPTVIVAGAGDPVATGLIDGLARPGGNITGISDVVTTLTTKRLGLLKGAVPNLRKVAMLWNKNDLAMTLRYEASAQAAVTLGVTVQPLGVGEPNDFDEAFAVMNMSTCPSPRLSLPKKGARGESQNLEIGLWPRRAPDALLQRVYNLAFGNEINGLA